MDAEPRRVEKILPAGGWIERTARDVVTPDFDDRFRRRKLYVGAKGTEILLDLPEARVLRDGDGLLMEGGGVVLVRAAAEPLIEVTSADPRHLLRLAWHLGNRHLPAEIGEGRMLIRHDHVILEMLKGLGAAVREVEAPFNPEGGAYEGHGHHHHGHAHDHHHHHDHDHDHGDGCDHHH